MATTADIIHDIIGNRPTDIRNGSFREAIRDMYETDAKCAYYKESLLSTFSDNDFIVGFVATSDCKFTIQYTPKYAETFDLAEGQFCYAWYGTVFPQVACPWFSPKVTIEYGTATVIHAVLHKSLREQFQGEVQLTKEVRVVRGEFFFNQLSLGRPSIDEMIVAACSIECRLRNEMVMLLAYLQEMRDLYG
jgi:hypothetical protein